MRERLRRLGLVVATAAAFVPTMQATAASAELHKNPSAETLSRGTPVNWSKSTWGTNTTTLKTTRAAHTGAVAMSVATTKYKSGAANWFQRVPVTAGKSYAFGVWYKSTVVTQLVAEFKLATGKVTYASLGSLTASSAYKRAGATFTAPAGAASVAIYLPLAAVGTIVTDDYSLMATGSPPPSKPTSTPPPVGRALVSVNFDDGWYSQYQNARPVLSAAGIKATFYIIGDSIGSTPTYTTASQIKQLAADGHEIGNHTWSHADLANLSSAAIATEFDKAQQAIVSKVGVTPTVCAYPYGSYNNTVVSVAGARFGNCRTTDGGLNTTSTLARTGAYRIMDFNVDSNTSVAMVKKAIDDAIAAKAWLVVVYHEVGASIGGGVWHTKTADLQAEMTYLRQQVAAGKAANVTMAQGYAATK